MIVAGIATIFACGPSTKENAEKIRQDSIRTSDSLKIITLNEKIKNDSLIKIKNESLAKIEKNNGDKYLGTWKDIKSNNKLLITKAGGETEFIVKHTTYGINKYADNLVSKAYYQNDGNLMVGGDDLLSFSNGIIIFKGHEYEKVK